MRITWCFTHGPPRPEASGGRNGGRLLTSPRAGPRCNEGRGPRLHCDGGRDRRPGRGFPAATIGLAGAVNWAGPTDCAGWRLQGHRSTAEGRLKAHPPAGRSTQPLSRSSRHRKCSGRFALSISAKRPDGLADPFVGLVVVDGGDLARSSTFAPLAQSVQLAGIEGHAPPGASITPRPAHSPARSVDRPGRRPPSNPRGAGAVSPPPASRRRG